MSQRPDHHFTAVTADFATVGIIAMYGGVTKGHGCWLYRAPAAAISRFQATRGYTHLDDCEALSNDGSASGNPHFWLWPDAIALLARLTAARAAFYGGDDALMARILDAAGYTLDGVRYPANGISLDECLTIAITLPAASP